MIESIWVFIESHGRWAYVNHWIISFRFRDVRRQPNLNRALFNSPSFGEYECINKSTNVMSEKRAELLLRLWIVWESKQEISSKMDFQETPDLEFSEPIASEAVANDFEETPNLEFTEKTAATEEEEIDDLDEPDQYVEGADDDADEQNINDTDPGLHHEWDWIVLNSNWMKNIVAFLQPYEPMVRRILTRIV